MKWKIFAASILMFITVQICLLNAEDAKSRNDVLSWMGEPSGKFKNGQNEVWLYDRGEIVLTNGYVKSASLLNDEELAQKKKTEEENARKAEEAVSLKDASERLARSAKQTGMSTAQQVEILTNIQNRIQVSGMSAKSQADTARINSELKNIEILKKTDLPACNQTMILTTNNQSARSPVIAPKGTVQSPANYNPMDAIEKNRAYNEKQREINNANILAQQQRAKARVDAVRDSTINNMPLVAENGDIRGADNDGDGRVEPVYVRGYSKQDGTYVRSHYRASPSK